MKFLWLDINCSYAHSSLALPALHAQLDKETLNNTEWNVVRGTTKSKEQIIIEPIISYKPDYIFSSCWLFNTEYLSAVTKKIKALLPDTNIILGGPEFLGDNNEYLINNPQITAVFKGEGEEMFKAFITSLINKDDKWRTIKGFEYLQNTKYKASEIAETSNFELIIPPYKSVFFNTEKPFVQLETSRGCFNSCKFCVSGISKCKVQDLSILQIKNALDFFVEKGIKEVRLLDRTFNANSARASKLIALFKTYNDKLKFHLEVHPALLSGIIKEHLKKVPKDLLHLEAGIQSLNQNVIDLSGRKGKCNTALEGLKFLTSLKLFEVHADLIAGLPGYTYEQCIQDLYELMQSNVTEIQLELLKLLPGTYFRYNSKNEGIIFSSITPYEVLETREISYQELNKLMYLSKAMDYWYNNKDWRNLFTEIIDSANTIKMLAEFMNKLQIGEQPLTLENKILLLYDFCKQQCPNKTESVSFFWIKNGLSLKKEPAKTLKTWDIKSEIANPFIKSSELNITLKENKFYYIEKEDETIWFWFNQSLKRNGSFKETIIKKFIF